MKKIVAALIACSLLFSLLLTPAQGSSIQPEEAPAKVGDINKDGRVGTDDALIALQMSVGKVTPGDETLVLADVNGDGGVTTDDALMLLQYAVRKLNLLPAAFDPDFPQCLDEWYAQMLTERFGEFIKEKFKDDEKFKDYSIDTVDFYGFYGGGAAVSARILTVPELEPVKAVIGGVEINCIHGIPIYYYKDGVFTPIDEAYEQGLLTADALTAIAGFTKEPAEPGEERSAEIIERFKAFVKEKTGYEIQDSDSARFSDYDVIREGVEVCIPTYGALPTAMDYEVVAGKYVFEYPCLSMRYRVICENKFYRLEEALEEGIISEPELAAFHFRVNHGVGNIGDGEPSLTEEHLKY